MRLRNAKLCGDCDEVFDSKLCPVCGRSEGVLISRFGLAPKSFATEFQKRREHKDDLQQAAH
jgi:hypothetical protein